MHHAQTKRDSFYLEEAQWLKGRNVIAFIALVGLVACVAGFAADRAQFFHSYLLSFCFAVTIMLGGMFFVMVQYLTGSAWSITVRRFMETIIAGMPVALLLFVPVALGVNYLYEWTNADVVAKEAVLRAKAGYLNPEFFTIRAIAYLVLWSIWALAIYGQSTKQDREKSKAQMDACSRWSAPGLLLVTATGTLASFDWIMSLDPKWYSTIFGLYCLSGGALAFFGVLTLIALGMRRAGVLTNSITEEHYHDLGKWMFALTMFWAYIAFSQYILIWYANIPEETIFFRNRMVGSWRWLSAALLFGRFILPFLFLIFRSTKRNLQLLGIAAGWVVAMHFVDMYWLIMPAFSKSGLAPSWMDLGALVGVAGVLGYAFWLRLRKKALVPIGDLRFEQGLNFENV
jgi:hypothetical protein